MSEWTSAGLVAAGQFSDPEHARLIYLAAAGLLAAGLLLAVGTWFWWRNAKVEHPALGPLEVMGTRRWLRGDFTERTRRLEAVRPAHMPDEDAGLPLELVDLELLRDQDLPHDFGDLADPTGGTVVDAELDVEAVLAAPAVPVDPEAVAPVAEREVVADPVVVEAEPVVEPEPVVTAPAVLQPALDPSLEPAAVESPSGGMLRSIVIDTSPKAREADADAPPVDPTPAAAPIDPLLRLWSE